MARIPLACSLSVHDAGTRVQEWRRFLNRDVVQVVRETRIARLRLQENDEALLCAVDLARREKRCCSFFDLRIVTLPDALWLEIEVPREAAAILDELVSLRLD
ncbi:MAG: hypothetical protein ACRDVP_02865 [Acidimicrobiales bacterium]